MPHNRASAEFIWLAVHLLAIGRGLEMHLFEGLPIEWLMPGMETALKHVATPFGALTFTMKVDESGKSALLEMEPLSDPSCNKIVVHQKGWALTGEIQEIELSSKSQAITIDIRPQNIPSQLPVLGLEAEKAGDDADLESINRHSVREEAVDHSPLDEVYGIGYIDL